MKREEILELLRLKEWNSTRLAAELDLTETTVNRWISGKYDATGPAAILMRLWLKEARVESLEAVPA